MTLDEEVSEINSYHEFQRRLLVSNYGQTYGESNILRIYDEARNSVERRESLHHDPIGETRIEFSRLLNDFGMNGNGKRDY